MAPKSELRCRRKCRTIRLLSAQAILYAGTKTKCHLSHGEYIVAKIAAKAVRNVKPYRIYDRPLHVL